MGGFECSTHRNKFGRRLDLIASTRHDEFAERDYARLIELGIRTCRDGLRWHLIEPEPDTYDFSSLESQVAAAKATGMQVVWDLFHYGYPDDIDIFEDEFIDRFGRFCEAATKYLCEHLGNDLIVCPVNEISFFSYVGGHTGTFYPGAKRRGDDLKKQLVRAAVEGTRAARSVCPTVRLMFTDPAIHVVTRRDTAKDRQAAERYRQSQFEAFDMVGSYDHVLDIIGLNYYFHNQWHHTNRQKIPPGHKLYRPLHQILLEFYERYRRPIILAETGIEDEKRPEWFRYICEQTLIAREQGADINGICLYPIANHPGWVDDRHCHNGLWDYADDSGHREIYEPLAAEILRQKDNFPEVRTS
jgi:beta-glucosidase/6-phospho-beta-glucosidase/beta-galactosidase